MDTPSDAAIMERAHSLASEAIHMVALQRRRLKSDEPEAESFVFRRWADFQFLVVSLRRLRQTGRVVVSDGRRTVAVGDALLWALEASFRPGLRIYTTSPAGLEHYNHTRRHSSIGNRPPVSRVRDVLRQNS